MQTAKARLDIKPFLHPQMREVLDINSRRAQSLAAQLEAEFGEQISQGKTDLERYILTRRANYLLGRRFWNEGAPGGAGRDFPIGQTGLKTRLYYPPATASTKPTSSGNTGRLPAILFIHGGGFILGNLDSHDRLCRQLCLETGAMVCALEYGLAPETKLPKQIDQCLQAFRWLRTQSVSLNINPEDICLAGDSAGAYLALATYLSLRDCGYSAKDFRCLLLFYGLYGLRDSISHRRWGFSNAGIDSPDLAFSWRQALPEESCSRLSTFGIGAPGAGGDENSCPPKFNYDLLTQDLCAHMPACFIAAAQFDPLLDDSRLLAQFLQAGQIPHVFKIYPGVLHGFVHYARVLPQAKQAVAQAGTFFKEKGVSRQEPHDRVFAF